MVLGSFPAILPRRFCCCCSVPKGKRKWDRRDLASWVGCKVASLESILVALSPHRGDTGGLEEAQGLDRDDQNFFSRGVSVWESRVPKGRVSLQGPGVRPRGVQKMSNSARNQADR